MCGKYHRLSTFQPINQNPLNMKSTTTIHRSKQKRGLLFLVVWIIAVSAGVIADKWPQAQTTATAYAVEATLPIATVPVREPVQIVGPVNGMNSQAPTGNLIQVSGSHSSTQGTSIGTSSRVEPSEDDRWLLDSLQTILTTRIEDFNLTVEAKKESPASLLSKINHPRGLRLQFKPFRSDNLEPVFGKIDLISGTKKVQTLTSYSDEVIPTKWTQDSKALIVCDIIGYRKIQLPLDLASLPADTSITFPLELVPMQLGDKSILYHVYFYPDAAIMKPESEYECKQLLAMLQNSPQMKIIIHGHSNSNQMGKIMLVGENNKNYFTTLRHKEEFGTAKRLSEERAEIIRRYLIDHGISADRMEVRAWGGKKPLYDKTSNQAHLNVRVEIEIAQL